MIIISTQIKVDFLSESVLLLKTRQIIDFTEMTTSYLIYFVHLQALFIDQSKKWISLGDFHNVCEAPLIDILLLC